MKRILSILLCAVLTLGCMTSCNDSVIPDPDDGDTTLPGDNTGDNTGDNPGDNPGGNDDDPGLKSPSRVLLMYFVGTSLDVFFRDNVEAAMRAMSVDTTGDGCIIYFRRASGTEWAIHRVSLDYKGEPQDELLKSYPAANLSDMKYFLSEMIGFAPAESYGLVFGGHGSAWLPKSVGGAWTSTYSVGTGGGSYFAPFGELPREDALPTRYFGEASVMFDVEEIAENMIGTGAKFDYVIFDDCFMSNIESLYAMRHATDYIIASPCEIMAAGFPYERIVPYIFSADGCDLEGVCRAFYEFYINYTYPSGCVALTKCSELEELAVRYANLLSGLTNDVDPTKLQYYEGLARHLFYDFGQYAELLSANRVLLNDFREQFDLAFPPSCRLNTPWYYTTFGSLHYIDVDYYSGVSISEPADRNVEANRATEWYRATHRQQHPTVDTY